MPISQNETGSILFSFWEGFEKEWCLFIFKCLVEFYSEATWSWAFFVGRLLITNSVSLLVTNLFKLFLFLSELVLVSCISRNLSISSWLSSLLVFHSSYLTILISVASVVMFPLSYVFLLFEPTLLP